MMVNMMQYMVIMTAADNFSEGDLIFGSSTSREGKVPVGPNSKYNCIFFSDFCCDHSYHIDCNASSIIAMMDDP